MFWKPTFQALPIRTDERTQKRAWRYKQGGTQTIPNTQHNASVVITKLVIKSAQTIESSSWEMKVFALHRAASSPSAIYPGQRFSSFLDPRTTYTRHGVPRHCLIAHFTAKEIVSCLTARKKNILHIR
jgi:hypothetical protein